ncbi:TetR/AcrR family transcriptional regulator [Myxococcus fulvus]|uniref:TetR/AcrR family transcriptional regulator n=1 Tax=Myxococcus fulvus TaxID=33 RepID=UPI003B9BD730
MSSEHRIAILDAATDSFSRLGFKKTSIEDIAKRAGIGKGTVYLHFESKEALLGAVIDRNRGEALVHLEAAVRRAGSPEAKLRTFIEVREAQLTRVTRTLSLPEATMLEFIPVAEPFLREDRARELALLESIIVEGKAQGAFFVREPRSVALGLLAGLHGITGMLLTSVEDARQRAALSEMLELVLRGLTMRSPVSDDTSSRG